MHTSTRRAFLQQSIAATAALTAANASAFTSPPRYNVVLLMSDEHNPKFSSLQGHPFLQTPNLERLAARGTLFENGYCPSPLCHPSRSAFMSGRRVHAIQCYNNCNVFPYEYPSYGAALHAAGVHSVHIGKTDVYRPTAQLGFSEHILSEDRPWPGDVNVSRQPLAVRVGDGPLRAAGTGPKDAPFEHDDHLVDAAVQWLETKPKTLVQPFVLSINIHKPHFPHHVTQALWDKYAKGADLPQHGKEAASAQHPYAQDHRQHFDSEHYTEEQIRNLRRGYLGCVEYVDGVVGRLLDTLEAEGLAENTIFIYTSDHGEMLGKFGMWWKCSLYEDAVRVPVVVAGPGFDGGKRVSTPVDLLDVQATLFHATGAPRPEDWVGLPLQEARHLPYERPLFAEYHGHGARGSSYMLRKDDWKLIWYSGGPHQLFNLKEDPEETNNVSESQPEKFSELEAHLREVCNPEAEHQKAEDVIGRQKIALIASGWLKI